MHRQPGTVLRDIHGTFRGALENPAIAIHKFCKGICCSCKGPLIVRHNTLKAVLMFMGHLQICISSCRDDQLTAYAGKSMTADLVTLLGTFRQIQCLCTQANRDCRLGTKQNPQLHTVMSYLSYVSLLSVPGCHLTLHPVIVVMRK